MSLVSINAVTNLSHKKWEEQTKGCCCNAHIPTQQASFYHFTFNRGMERLFRFTRTCYQRSDVKCLDQNCSHQPCHHRDMAKQLIETIFTVHFKGFHLHTEELKHGRFRTLLFTNVVPFSEKTEQQLVQLTDHNHHVLSFTSGSGLSNNTWCWEADTELVRHCCWH